MRKEKRVSAAPPSSRASVAICQSETHTHTHRHEITTRQRELEWAWLSTADRTQKQEEGRRQDKMKEAGQKTNPEPQLHG